MVQTVSHYFDDKAVPVLGPSFGLTGHTDGVITLAIATNNAMHGVGTHAGITVVVAAVGRYNHVVLQRR